MFATALVCLGSMQIRELKLPTARELAGEFNYSGGFTGESLVLAADGTCAGTTFTDVVMPNGQDDSSYTGAWRFYKEDLLIDTATRSRKTSKRVTILLRWAGYWVIIATDDVNRFVDDLREEQKNFPKANPFMVGQPLSAYLHREIRTRATRNWNLIQAPKKWIPAFRKALSQR